MFQPRYTILSILTSSLNMDTQLHLLATVAYLDRWTWRTWTLCQSLIQRINSLEEQLKKLQDDVQKLTAELMERDASNPTASADRPDREWYTPRCNPPWSDRPRVVRREQSSGYGGRISLDDAIALILGAWHRQFLKQFCVCRRGKKVRDRCNVTIWIRVCLVRGYTLLYVWNKALL